MSELLATERTYVGDLRLCVEVYMAAFRGSIDVPTGLRGKERTLFGNLEEIFLFHRDVFLGELEKYSRNPEDVGHCFVRWAHKFDMYVEYCRNKPESNNLLVQVILNVSLINLTTFNNKLDVCKHVSKGLEVVVFNFKFVKSSKYLI